MIGINGIDRHSQVVNDILVRKTERVEKTDADIFTQDLKLDKYSDALMNTVKLWLLSSKWDRIRKPGWAGFFDNRMGRYTMNEDGAAQATQELSEAFKGKIPGVVLSDIHMKPKLVESGWEVGVSAVDTETGVYASYKEATNPFVLIQKDPNLEVTAVNTIE